MSDESDSKMEVQADACDSGGSVDTDHVMKRVPDDVWRVLLECLAQADSMLLSRTCSWLNDAVVRNITSLELKHFPAAFPAARFASLQRLWTAHDVDVAAALPVLCSCPQLRRLELYCNGAEGMDAVVAGIALLPRLQSVYLRSPTVDGRLGKALASCKQLRHVQLFMRKGSDRRRGRQEFVCDFLRELTALPALRSLDGLYLRDAGDTRELCIAVGAWRELHELNVQSYPDTDGGGKLEAPLRGIAAALHGSCPRLRKLSLVTAWRTEYMRLGAEVDIIARMSELRELSLSGELSAAAFQSLATLTKLEKLTLAHFSMDGEAGKQLGCLIQQLPLTALYMNSFRSPAEAIGAVLLSIATHSSLAVVEIAAYFFILNNARKEVIGRALAEAVCRSSVRKWGLAIPFSLTSFLRVWNGCTPAAAVTSLGFSPNDRHACEDEQYAELLLRCLRSCPSLRVVRIVNRHADVHAIVAAVRDKPLAPTMLTLRTTSKQKRLYSDAREELAAAGLVLG